MNKLFIVLLAVPLLLLSSCGKSKEEKAEDRLAAAKLALEQENFNAAKLQIDSIKILYPNEFKIRKNAQDFLCVVVLKEQQRNLRYLTSMLQTKQQEFETIKSQYKFEKNLEYQDIGNYFWPSQTVERNLHRSFLRFQVNEHGIMTMTSIYCGSHHIHHKAVKVETSDGCYAETPTSKDIYESDDMGEKNEKADFPYGQDGGVINFIYLNRQKNIHVEYLGEQRYSLAMSPSDIQALKNIYSLTKVLSAIQKIKKDIEDANVKIKFIITKQKYDALHHHNQINNKE